MDNNKEKLRALCEGLELENIDLLLRHKDVEPFKVFGEEMAKRIKAVVVQAHRDDLTKSVVKDKHGKDLVIGDRVKLDDSYKKEPPIFGTLLYDRWFWAYKVESDDKKRYLLMDCLHTCIEFDDGYGWEEIEKVEKDNKNDKH